MQYLVNVIDSHSNSGTDEEGVAIHAFNEKLRTGGHWVFAAGLADIRSDIPTPTPLTRTLPDR
jgi:hypothetical protein